jgi:dienelactone hydrolase
VGHEAAAVVPAAAAPAQHGPPYAVGERVLTFVDPRRTIKFPKHPRQPRTLVTVVRYPAPGPPSQVDVRDAPPDRADGPFPLVVFGHGFDVTPATYFRLLRAWAAAGYVVAAPVFPRENAHAPGGADEDDLVNQPRDMSVVISGLLAATGNPRAPLAGTIDPGAIAVSGQSDGGETALATAYDRRLADPRVRAAIILSGAQIPRWRYRYRPGGPPLLAAQGTADKINLPHYTYSFFRAARRPKFLLSLIHAGHLPPYTAEQPQLGIVERVSVDFLDRYLKGDSLGVAALSRDGRRAGIAALTADP